MSYSATAAAIAVAESTVAFEQLKRKYPEAMAELQALWMEHYPQCGHRPLARVLVALDGYDWERRN